MNRRDIIRGAGQLAILAGLSARPVWGAELPKGLFALGVASGDPWPDGFVIWTRLAPKPAEPGSGMPMASVPVRWEVAEDERFARIVRQGEALARPELGHSVHVEVDGLRPARRYWYRFVAGSEASPAGSAKSAPAAGAAVDRLRIGVAGCQHYEGGLFTAYKHLAAEDDLDAIFHYGDYIYEHSPTRGCPKEGKQPACGRLHDSDEIYSIDDYRRRYALYKGDADLQAAHRAAAFLPTWDDHEIENNWAGEWDENGTPPELFVLRRAMAMQAWYENMPVRRAQIPAIGRVRMFRRLDYGNLLRIHLLDTRQYRTDQRCGPGKESKPCRAASDTGPSEIIGREQEAWLGEGLGGGSRWNLIAQQVMVMPYTYPEARAAGRANMDSWSGYPEARARLTRAISERKLTNVVVATGDVHKHHAGVVPSREGALDSAPVATEYVCTSISSGGDGADFPEGWDKVPGDNPHAPYVSDRRGYQVFDLGPREWRTEVVGVGKVSAPGGARRTLARFVTVPEKPGAVKA